MDRTDTWTCCEEERTKFKILFDGLIDLNISNKHFELLLANDYESYKWRYEKFLNEVINGMYQTALTNDERNACIADDDFERMRESAKEKLKEVKRNQDKEPQHYEKGGEIGEMLLYRIMAKYYDALPIVPKIFYKQNYNDYAKGADSVHIVVKDDEFSLWFGESKFYKDINRAIDSALKSISNFLSNDKQIRNENRIITNLKELEKFNEITKEMASQITKTLDRDNSLDNIKQILHIPILLIYECKLTKEETEMSDKYKDNVKKDMQKHSRKMFEELREIDIPHIDKIFFHIILFPVPDKNKIVKETYKQLGFPIC